MPESFDFQYKFCVYHPVKDHDKFFVILNQALADGSFPDLNIAPHTIEIPFFGGRPLWPYCENFTQQDMNLAKINNIMMDAINITLSEYLHGKYYSGTMFLTKMCGKTKPDTWWPRPSLIYLPQINQILFYDKEDFDEKWLMSHEYVLVIPLHQKIPTISNPHKSSQ